MSALFPFGEYAGYVWFTYGVSMVALGALAFVSWRAHAAAQKRAAAVEEAPPS